MADPKHTRDHVWIALLGSVLLAAFALWVLSGRSERWYVKAEASFAHCGTLSAAEKSSCFSEAAGLYKRAVRDFPFRGRYFAGLGRAYEASGDAAAARREFGKARILGWRQ